MREVQQEKKALGFLSPSAHEKMTASALGQTKKSKKQIIGLPKNDMTFNFTRTRTPIRCKCSPR